MRAQTYLHHPDRGWDRALPAEMDSEQTLVIVFGAPETAEHRVGLDELRNTFRHSRIVGCSTAGEIQGAEISDRTLSVAIARFEHTRLVGACVPVATPQDSFTAGRSLAETLATEGLRNVLVLSDGLKVNGSALVRGLGAGLDESVVVTGGLAGDGARFGETWVLHDGAPMSGVVSAVGFYGDRLHVGHGSMGGWDVFGPERTVTRSEGNVLYELDGKPALELYKKYLGDRASGLPATALLFPLSLRSGRDDARRVVRTILAVDDEQQSLTFAGDIPVESLVRLMRANLDRLVDGASEAARLANPGDDYEQVLSIAVSCVGRRLVLGERVEEEIEAALETLPGRTQQIGFYSYGEISPYASGRCDLHNQTMTLTTLAERG